MDKLEREFTEKHGDIHLVHLIDGQPVRSFHQMDRFVIAVTQSDVYKKDLTSSEDWVVLEYLENFKP